MFDIIIIGAGTVGAFVSRNLARYKCRVLLLDKENDVGNVTTMANSAIVHSGYDPEVGTLKAKFNVLGNKMFPLISKELDVAFGKLGSITVAFDDEQVATLKELEKRSALNGVEVKILDRDELLKMEPNLSSEVKAGLLAPSAGIIDPFNLCAHCVENAMDNGVELSLNTCVKDIQILEDKTFKVITNKGEFITRCVVNAAGLHSDEIASMIEEIDWKITPRKGEYFILDHYAPGLVKHTIFPVPSKKGKGILVSPTTSGNYILGPSSELTNDKDDLGCDKLTLDNIRASVLNMVPSIPFKEQIRVFSGLRATCTRHDFVIEPSKKHELFINLGGIESPGLVSSPAIGEYVVEKLIQPIMKFEKNEAYNPNVKKYTHLNSMTIEERNKLIKDNSDFGHIICNCEKISEGEIKELFTRSLKPHSVKAVKKRCRAGFGKCQGGFCQSPIVDIISKELNISPLDVLYDGENSNILLYRLKEDKTND